MSSQLWWWVARASGLIAWGLLTATMLWGLGVSTRLFGRKPPPAWLLDLHRFLGGLSVVFMGVHLFGLWADSYTHFGPMQLFVPLASKWHPIPVAFGVVGFYLLIAIELTSLAMKKIPRKLWKHVHRLSFALYALATVHMISAGTDAKHHAWAFWAAVASALAILFLWLVRVLSPRGSKARAGAAAHPHPTARKPHIPHPERVGAGTGAQEL